MKIIDAALVIQQHGLPYFRELATFGALPDEVITYILENGIIRQYQAGEYISRMGETAGDFQVVLAGKMAFYKHHEDHDTLTRYFNAGEQMGFDLMMGLLTHNGTDVAIEDSLILEISSSQFHGIHVNYPEAFGILMINLSRELSREIAMLEDVIGQSSGWNQEA